MALGTRTAVAPPGSAGFGVQERTSEEVRSSDDAVAARVRGFGPLGVVSILVILAGNLLVAPLSAILVLLWAWRSQTPWRALGFVRPASWAVSLAVGVAFGGTLKLSDEGARDAASGADPINRAYHHLVGNTAALPGMLYAVVIGHVTHLVFE